MDTNIQHEPNWSTMTVLDTYRLLSYTAYLEQLRIVETTDIYEDAEAVLIAARQNFNSRRAKLQAYMNVLDYVYESYDDLFNSPSSPFNQIALAQICGKYRHVSVALLVIKLERILIDMFHVINEEKMEETSVSTVLPLNNHSLIEDLK